MSFTVTRLTQPAFDALDDDDLREWVRLEADVDSATLAMLLASASDQVEALSGHTIAQSTYRIEYGELCTSYRLPVYPVQSVTSVTYLDDAGAAQPVSYTRSNNTLTLASYPPAPITVTLIGGYTSPDSIPAPLRQAIAVLVSTGYDDRDGLSSDVLAGVQRILSGQRRVWL